MEPNNITVTREDKSKKIVFVKEAIYNQHLEEYINETGAEMLNRDPTQSLDNKWSKIRKRKNLPDFLRTKRIPNPACPNLFAYAKTHKSPVTYRPIVEKCRSPLYNLEKAMAKWVNNKLADYNYVVNSTTGFIQKLKNLQLNGGETFITCDFEKLYPSLNIAPVTLCFYRFLLTNLRPEQPNPVLCRDLADLLCNNSYFTFRGKYYRQVRGVPIGSPSQGN